MSQERDALYKTTQPALLDINQIKLTLFINQVSDGSIPVDSRAPLHARVRLLIAGRVEKIG
jgi:hypothetical protein